MSDFSLYSPQHSLLNVHIELYVILSYRPAWHRLGCVSSEITIFRRERGKEAYNRDTQVDFCSASIW